MVRFKNRWLLLSLDIPSPHPPTTSSSPTQPTITCPPSSLITAIRTSLSTHFGPTAVGALGTGSSLSIKYSSDTTRLAILRCARTGSEVVRGSVSLVGELEVNVVTPSGGGGAVGGKAGGGGGGKTSKKMVVPARIHVVAVSGTIKKLQEHVIRMDRRRMEKRRKAVKQRGRRKGNKGAALVEQEMGEEDEAPGGAVAAGVEHSSSVKGEAGGQDKAAPSQSAIPAMPAFDDDEEDLGLAV